MLTLRALDEAQLPDLYERHMRRDFPESELKPLKQVLRLFRRGVYDVLGAYDGDELAAYALVYRRAGGVAPLLDYFAVEPSRRGHGAGSEALALLRGHYGRQWQALLIECERPDATPDRAGAEARIRFYEHAGARCTNLRARLFGVEFRILCLPCTDAATAFDCEAELRALYLDMLTPEVFARCGALGREA